MKAPVVLLGALLILAATSASPRPSASASTATGLLRLPRATRAGETSIYGHIRSLRLRRGRWELKLDPALPLHGLTAERAALEDTGSADVPNDVYTVEEGHRLLTYLVPKQAPVTILTRGPRTTSVSVRELASILRGGNPNGRRLFGQPRQFGFWLRVGAKYPAPVLSIDEQYTP